MQERATRDFSPFFNLILFVIYVITASISFLQTKKKKKGNNDHSQSIGNNGSHSKIYLNDRNFARLW